jgi:serine/threonine-protein phosphatase 2B regulatory subunit
VTEELESSHTLSRFAVTRNVGYMNNVDRHVCISTGSCTPRAGVQRTKYRLKRVQSEKMIQRKDPKTSKEQIIMLKEVYQQLNMIGSHMRPSSNESPRNDTSLDSVMEVIVFSNSNLIWTFLLNRFRKHYHYLKKKTLHY